MRHALLLFALAFVASAGCSSNSSGGSVDSGPRGDGGCLLDKPVQGAPCTGDEVLCDPGNLCCGGEWRCDASHTWNLVHGGCPCFSDGSVPLDAGE